MTFAERLADAILLIVGHDLTTVLPSERAAAIAAAQAGIDEALERAAKVAEDWTKHHGFNGIGDKKRFDAQDVQRSARVATFLVGEDIRAMKGGK